MTDHKPFVSIVVPCFNSLKTLPPCLDALDSQSYPRERFEIILADNGSTDGTQNLVAEYYPRVRLMHASEKGSGYARNAGMREAVGEYILSSDSDCVADPNWVATMVEAFEKSPPAVAAIGGPILPYSEKTSIERFPEAWISQPDLEAPDQKVRYTATPNAVFRSSAIQQVGGFDGTLGFDDTDLGIRLVAAGYQIGYAPNAIIRHRNPASWRELYKHRLKYGEFSYALAAKHPSLLGDPRGKRKRRTLFAETTWRIAKDLVKLPFSIFSRPQKPQGWPLIDIVIAWGNYKGFSRASERMTKSHGA